MKGDMKAIISGVKVTNICLNVTLSCNEKCIFCFRNFYTSQKTLYVEKLKNMIPYLKNLGIRKITLIGGEPLLNKDILKIAEILYDEGFILSLTTNATIYKPEILNYLTYLSFSLESVNKETNRLLGRNEKHLENIERYLEEIRKKNLDLKVKINTVITSVNAREEELNGIAEFIRKNSDLIVRWKIFRFLSVRRALNKPWLSVSRNRFKELMKFCEELVKDLEINVSNGDTPHYVLDGDGLFYLATPQQGDIILGKFLDF